MTQVIEETKGTEAKLMTAFAAQIGAGANADRAKVAALEEKRKQEADLGKKLRNLEYTDDAYAERLEAARKKDKTGAAAEAIIQNKRTELIKQSFPALRDELTEDKPKPKAEEKPKPKAEAKAEAPKAEPKKAEPKKTEVPKKPDIGNIDGAPAGSSVGSYVAGKGWEVKGKNGKLLGYAPQ